MLPLDTASELNTALCQ